MSTSAGSPRKRYSWSLAGSLLAFLALGSGCSSTSGDVDDPDLDVDAGANDASEGDGSALAKCGQRDHACCEGAACYGGLVCESGRCVANPNGDGEEDAGPVPCGKAGQACCPDTGCGTNLVCEDGECVKKGTAKPGTACTKGSDCKSNVCLPLSNGSSVCTSVCNTDNECLSGWDCATRAGQSERICQCQPRAEACNGRDDDCNGAIDDIPACQQTCERPGDCSPATELSITGVVLYQAVGIPLMWNGSEVATRIAPIIAGKDAMLRVHVSPRAGFQARTVTAWLELHGSGGLLATYPASLQVTGASDDKKLATTFNFDIPGALMTADLRYRVLLREASPHADFPGTAASATWPGVGVMQLNPQSSFGNLKITLIPYRYNGRLPDTTEKQLQAYRDKFASYPVPGIEISIHEPIDHSGTFNAQGTGWNQLLTKTCNLRNNERPAKNDYYYGIISPTADFATFCGSGCVAGLANLATNPSDNYSRCGIGLGFTGSIATETAVHEIGHTLGREHAPCGNPATTDKFFPHANGGIGVRGYDLPRKALREPTTYKDFMGYCSPVWISDYTYNALFDRIRFVNASPLVKLPPGFPDSWRSIVVESDGSLHLAENVQLDTPPSGTPTTIHLLDANGAEYGTAQGYLYDTDHLPGGSLLVPTNELRGAKAIRLEGGATLHL